MLKGGKVHKAKEMIEFIKEVLKTNCERKGNRYEKRKIGVSYILHRSQII